MWHLGRGTFCGWGERFRTAGGRGGCSSSLVIDMVAWCGCSRPIRGYSNKTIDV
jgi:hypothetical protein